MGNQYNFVNHNPPLLDTMDIWTGWDLNPRPLREFLLTQCECVILTTRQPVQQNYKISIFFVFGSLSV